MQVNDYKSPYYNVSGMGEATASSVTGAGKGSSNLGVDDFLKLLVAQLANQDMMNPSSDTEFIAQMAQFSSLQAMDSMAKVSILNQATDLVGKKVVVASYDKSNKLVTDEGIVDRVSIYGNSAKIYVNGKEYEYANVMEIKNVTGDDSKETTKDDSNEDTKDDSSVTIV